MTAPALALENASVGWGDRTVLAGVTLEIPAGVHAALLGPNGAGKSTLLRTLAGVQKCLAGRVLVEGRPLGEFSPTARARRIAYLPQLVSPEIPFTVFEVVLMGRYPHRGASLFASDEDRRIVGEVLARTGLEVLAQQRCTRLSGGEFQRVLAASILAQQAPVMLLDEPTASLDLRYRSSILGMTRASGPEPRTVVIATHDIDLALVHCSWVVLLDGKGGVQCGPMGEVVTPRSIRDVFGVEVLPVDVPRPDGSSCRRLVVLG